MPASRLLLTTRPLSIKKIGVLLTIALVCLTDCGFHLRGSADVPKAFQSLYLTGSQSHSRFISEARRILTQNGITVVQSPEEAEYTLFVINEYARKRALALSENFRDTAEFELYSEVEIEIRHRDGHSLTMPRKIFAQRIFTNDETQTRAKEREEALLETEIQWDITQQLIKQLQSISQQLASSPHADSRQSTEK